MNISEFRLDLMFLLLLFIASDDLIPVYTSEGRLWLWLSFILLRSKFAFELIIFGFSEASTLKWQDTFLLNIFLIFE